MVAARDDGLELAGWLSDAVGDDTQELPFVPSACPKDGWAVVAHFLDNPSDTDRPGALP